MRVLVRAAHAKLNVRDAFETARDGRPSRGVFVARLPDAAVRAEPLAVARHECGEMRRPALLLAFVQHTDPKRELPHRGAVGVDRLEARHQMALVVRNAAAVEEAVAFGRLEGWRLPLVERIRRLYVVVVVDKKGAIAATGLADDCRRSAVDGQRFRGDAPAFLRSVEDDAGSFGNPDPLRRDGRLPDQGLQLIDVFALPGAHVRIEVRESGHAGRLASGRNGRRSGLAFSELAPRRVRRDLDPTLLAEVMDDTVEVLDRLALVDLRARDHVNAVAAIRGACRPWARSRASGRQREAKAREGQNEKYKNDEEDTKTTHIRRGLPPVLTLAGGLENMTIVRVLCLASVLAGLALVACGSAGSGGSIPPTANPALGTNKPATSPMPSGDPYSDSGY